MGYRVIIWGTGEVGRHAIRAFAERRLEFDIVGTLVYDPKKDGRDIGEIAGIAPFGVKATTDKAAILAMKADCVLHVAMGEVNPEGTIDEICGLLASGKNVVTTSLIALTCPKVLGPAVVSRIEKACAEGRTTMHGTGICPGFLNDVLPYTLSGLFRRIERIDVAEAASYALYPSPAIMTATGFGRVADDPAVLHGRPEFIKRIYGASVQLLADALGVELEGMEARRDVRLAPEAFDVAAGRIEKGTVAGMHMWCAGIYKGKQVIRAGIYARMRRDIGPEWPEGEGWILNIDGDPTLRLQAQIGVNPGDDYTDKENLGTAMHALHAIPRVIEAWPGIKTVIDIPFITGRGLIDPR